MSYNPHFDPGWKDPLTWIVFGVIVVVAVLAIIGVAHSRDLDGRYAQSPLKEWFDSLRSSGGAWCCYETDGARVYDPDWERTKEGFRVRLYGQWYDVPPQANVTVPNKAGYAVVWQYIDEKGKVWIKCFLPGNET